MDADDDLGYLDRLDRGMEEPPEGPDLQTYVIAAVLLLFTLAPCVYIVWTTIVSP